MKFNKILISMIALPLALTSCAGGHKYTQSSYSQQNNENLEIFHDPNYYVINPIIKNYIEVNKDILTQQEDYLRGVYQKQQNFRLSDLSDGYLSNVDNAYCPDSGQLGNAELSNISLIDAKTYYPYSCGRMKTTREGFSKINYKIAKHYNSMFTEEMKGDYYYSYLQFPVHKEDIHSIKSIIGAEVNIYDDSREFRIKKYRDKGIYLPINPYTFKLNIFSSNWRDLQMLDKKLANKEDVYRRLEEAKKKREFYRTVYCKECVEYIPADKTHATIPITEGQYYLNYNQMVKALGFTPHEDAVEVWKNKDGIGHWYLSYDQWMLDYADEGVQKVEDEIKEMAYTLDYLKQPHKNKPLRYSDSDAKLLLDFTLAHENSHHYYNLWDVEKAPIKFSNCDKFNSCTVNTKPYHEWHADMTAFSYLLTNHSRQEVKKVYDFMRNYRVLRSGDTDWEHLIGSYYDKIPFNQIHDFNRCGSILSPYSNKCLNY